MTDRIKLSAIVLTHNEEINIAECLMHLRRVEDVAIVDSGSTDNTLAVARATRPDVRVFERAFTDFGDQRNWALDNAAPRYEWVLFVDADEFCDDALLDEAAAFTAAPAEFVGAFVAGRNYFLGRWLKYSTMYPSYQLRLLKLGEVRFRKAGHGQAEVTDGPLLYLKNGWRHEGFSKGVSQWIERHNKYTSEEASLFQELRRQKVPYGALFGRDPVGRRRALKVLFSRLPGRPLWQFFYLYVWRRGFLDGYAGLLYCGMVASNQFITVVKQYELSLRASE